MKRLAWGAGYAGLFYLGFVVALNTVWERAERSADCDTGCCW